MPVLNLAARVDHVAPPESCAALDGLVGSTDCTSIIHDTGHLGIALGKDIAGRPTTRYWDEIDAWLGVRDAA
jgi:polyhydroxyalkanoate synthase